MKKKPIDFRIIVRDHFTYVGQERKKFLCFNYWKDIYETIDIFRASSYNSRILNHIGCNLISCSDEYNDQLAELCPLSYERLDELTKDKIFYSRF